jgi:rubrerythrin
MLQRFVDFTVDVTEIDGQLLFEKCDFYMTHKISKDFKEALAGEGWAINDYTDLIAREKDPSVRAKLTEIRDEEKKHQSELLEISACRGNV